MRLERPQLPAPSLLKVNRTRCGSKFDNCAIIVCTTAEGDYDDVPVPKKKVMLETRKVREIYEIDEEDEK
jgi:hypothetical protein